MRAELEIFILDNYSIEKQALIRNSFEIFDNYEIDDYDTPFMELISIFDDQDRQKTIDEFEELVKISLLSIIKEQGVELVEEAELEVIVEIASGLFDIQYYEDKESIIRTIEVDEETNVKLANLLVFVSILSFDRIFMALQEVNENIFNLLLQTCTYSDSEESIPQEISQSTKEVINRLKSYKEFTKLNDLTIFKIISKGFSVKLSFDFYYRYLRNVDFTNKDVRTIALEYFGAILASSEGYNNPLNHFRKISNKLFDDINLITKLDIEFVKIVQEFDKHISIGSVNA